MLHSSYVQPDIVPMNGTNTRQNIDRLQDLSATVTLNRSKVKEIGRDGIVGWKVNVPSVSLTMKQLEYGSIAFWNALANDSAANQAIVLNDFKLSQNDILCYSTQDTGAFLGTMQYPAMRVDGFDIDIGSPMDIAMRSFTLVGEDEIFWQNSNAYVVQITDTGATNGTYVIAISHSGTYSSYPVPVLDPDTSANYIIRIMRNRSGVDTQLVQGTDFTYNSANQHITFTAAATSDTYKIWYTAASYISGAVPFVDNNSDVYGIPAEQVSIFLNTGNYVYRLQSAKISVKFTREDLKEIGNTQIVTRGIKDKTVTVTLGRNLETFTIEQLLRGVSSTYGKIDASMFSNNVGGSKLFVYMYDSKLKTNFKLGYTCANLSPTSLSATTPLNAYETRQVTMEGENLLITNLLANMSVTTYDADTVAN